MARVVRRTGIALAIFSLLCVCAPVAALTCTWNGGLLNANWNFAGNWIGCVIPGAGDDLEFPDAALGKAMNDDIPDLSVNSIKFLDASGGYSLTGTGNLRISGAAAIVSKAQSPNNNTLALTNPLKFGAPIATIDTSGSGGAGKLFLNGPIDLNGSTLNFVWDSPVPYTIVNGVISGAGGISVNGIGSDTGLQLFGNNTFTGPVVVTTGYLGVFHSNALGAGGSAGNGTTVQSFATLIVGADIANEYLTFEGGDGESGNGMIQSTNHWIWGGPVTLNAIGAPRSNFNLLTRSIEFTGVVSGSGGIRCCNGSTGRLVLSNPGNTYSGQTFYNGSGGTLRVGVANGLSPNSALSINATGGTTLDLQGFSAAAAALTGGANATLAIDAAQTLTVTSAVTLGNTTLALALSGVTPPIGTELKIVDKTSAGPVTGTFNGLAEGAPVTVGTTGMTISYAGGNGNDVTLTVTSGSYDVSVVKSGKGEGAVKSDSGAINCGATCSDVYASGTMLVLEATPDPGSIFTGWLGPCSGIEKCSFTVGGTTVATATFAPDTLGTAILDVDDNHAYDALTDGLLATRYMFGLSGAPLIAGGLGPSASRSDPGDIVLYLTHVAPYLDIDGDGQLDPFTDGVLIIRFLFGMHGDELIADAVGKSATRTLADDIEKYLLSLTP